MTDPKHDAPVPGSLSWRALVLAVALGAGAPLLWWGLADAPTTTARAAAAPRPAVPVVQAAAVVNASPVTLVAQAPAAAQPAGPAVAPRVIARVRDPNGDQSPDITDFINAGEVPSMAEVISRLHAAGVRSGLGAFSPPGTRPPMIGVAVADDFELPPGYVRHHQATDDGQRIEAILMYAPDHPLAAGATSAQDRVVPADRLPPGLPARLVTLPPPASPGK